MSRRWSLVVAALVTLVVACAHPPVPPKASLARPTAVPIQTVEQITLVSVTVNRSQQAAVFVVDTGASWTILSPLLAARLGLSVPADAVRRDLRIVGGQIVTVPFIRINALQVGEAVVEAPEVGVYDVAPQARVIDGLLGGDFLNRFNVTLDRQGGRLLLEPIPDRRR